MLIKLNYTNIKTAAQAWRVVADIIATPTVTSISALRNREIAASYSTDLLQYFDDATSYIYRTKDSTGVVSHVARPATASGSSAFDLMLEFPTYDASSTKQYYRLYSSLTSGSTMTEQYGTVISAAMNSTAWAPSGTTSGTTGIGTVLTITGGASSSRQMTTTSNGLTTLWVYITPYSLVWAAVFNGATFQPSGWYGTNSSYNASATFTGPNIYSQYRRYDYWNTASNNVFPFVYQNPNVGTTNFLTSTSELGIVNTNSSTAAECPLMFHSYINAVPGTGTSFPVQYATRAAIGVGTRYSDTFALTSSASGSTNPTDPCYGAVLNTSAVQTRIPSSDLLTKGFSILPITVRNLNVGMLGGNISDIGDFYLFNGDYFPGDEFSYNNRTFVIFPVGLGYTTRLGLAIPKE